MNHYTAKKFNISKLDGISEKNITEHIKLYEGYVKNTNVILESMYQNAGSNVYEIKEMRRRLGFEFDGMRNHEHFFTQWEDGAQESNTTSNLYKKIKEQFGSFENWKKDFVEIAKTRGIGWAILYYDRTGDTLINVWVDEQHLGHIQGADFIVGIDMWEHAFVYDYATSEKAAYIDTWYKNLNWNVIEKRLPLTD